MRKFLCISFMFCAYLLGAQEDLREDAAFFQAQGEVYSQWLERTGLNQYLKIHLVEVDSELVSIYLEPVEQPEVVFDVYARKAVWDTVSTVYFQEYGDQLGRSLLYKMLYLFELDEQQANVQFFNTYDQGVTAGYRYILAWYFDEQGEFQEYRSVGSTIATSNRAKDMQIHIDLSAAEDCSANGTISSTLAAEDVYSRILAYAQSRFGEATCSGRKPSLRVRENRDVLRFEADDLCRTVLYDETNSVLCRISSRLGFNCNSIEREQLHFIISYSPTESGFRLNCTIDGKYADTWGRPRRGDYKSMEENPEFAEYLTLFAEVFTEELRIFLEE